MKKIFTYILVFVVLLALFGCASTDDSKEPNESTDEVSASSSNATADSYDPLFVDTITSDLDEMNW